MVVTGKNCCYHFLLTDNSLSAERDGQTGMNPEDGMKYLEILGSKVAENGELMYTNIEEIPESKIVKKYGTIKPDKL